MHTGHIEVHKKRKEIDTKQLPWLTPSNIFLACHECATENLCNDNCYDELEGSLTYSDCEINDIEVATRRRAANQNWHAMRLGILTASNVKKIYHSTNYVATAEVLLNELRFDTENPPPNKLLLESNMKVMLGTNV